MAQTFKQQKLVEEHFQYSSQLVKFVNDKGIHKEDIVGISDVGRFGEGKILFYFTYEYPVQS
jgi:hypothetical protein